MDDFSSFLDEIGADEKKKKPSPRRKDLANPLGTVPTSEVRRAKNPQGKDTAMVGQQIRRSILIAPEMDETINRLCKQYGVKKMAMLRFLIGKGIEAVHDGALEGNLIRKVVMELPEPDWRG